MSVLSDMSGLSVRRGHFFCRSFENEIFEATLFRVKCYVSEPVIFAKVLECRNT
jgi:hypothetical protein